MADNEAELRKAFEEVQIQMIQEKQKMEYLSHQMEVKQREIRKTQLTAQEIDELPKDTKCYLAVGRMFINQSKPDLSKNLKTQEDANTKELKNLEMNKKYIENMLKEKDHSLQELLMQRARMQAAK
eukprot:CFRG1184T1